MNAYKVRKELEEAGARVSMCGDAPDDKPHTLKKEEPDPEVHLAFALYVDHRLGY